MKFSRGALAEDVWDAFGPDKTVGEKKRILTLNKHSIWDLKSNEEGTKGKTTLMYLIEKSCLDKKTIAKMVPAKAWAAKDECGATPFDYLYKRWIQSEGESNIDISGADINISAEKYASLVWYGINYQTGSSYRMTNAGITDLSLVTPPKVLSTGEDIDNDSFWGAFFKNDNAIDVLLRAVISTDGLSLHKRSARGEPMVIDSKYREDFAIWRKSLQKAKMKDGKRWIESSKKIADITVSLYLMENILLTEKEFGDIDEAIRGHGIRRISPVAKSWSNEMSKVLTDLYGAGGSISSVLEAKDKICIKHKKKISEVTEKGIITHFDIMMSSRRSNVEDFDANVLGMVHNLNALLDHWRAFEEKIRLSLVCDNRKEGGKLPPQLYL